MFCFKSENAKNGKRNESIFIKTIDRANLTEETNFRLDKIGKIENYFHE